MYKNNSIPSNLNEGVLPPSLSTDKGLRKFSSVIPLFLKWARYDRNLSPQTVEKYEQALRGLVRDIGDLEVQSLDLGHVTILKQKIMDRGCGASYISQNVFAIRCLLRYCRDVLEMEVMDDKKILPPRRGKKDVVYLTNDEVKQFIEAIPLENNWKGGKKESVARVNGVRFRTLVEVLLGTGMRISEALSLDRNKIDFDKAEAKIVGKGNKERVVFFTERSLHWIKYYLELRKDENFALFVTREGTRWRREDISFFFKLYTKKSGIDKKITPHILRHTVATNLLFNGCPIGHIKEILGHENLITTCKYYLGLDKRLAKEAHSSFLSY